MNFEFEISNAWVVNGSSKNQESGTKGTGNGS